MNAALWKPWKPQNANKHAELGEIKYQKCVWKNSFLRQLCSCLCTMNHCPFQEKLCWKGSTKDRYREVGREEHRSCRRDLLHLSDDSRKVSVCFCHDFSTCWASSCAKAIALPCSPSWIICATQVSKELWDLTRTFSIFGMEEKLSGLNLAQANFFFYFLFQFFFPWDFPSSLSHCKRVDLERENTILKGFFFFS